MAAHPFNLTRREKNREVTLQTQEEPPRKLSGRLASILSAFLIRVFPVVAAQGARNSRFALANGNNNGYIQTEGIIFEIELHMVLYRSLTNKFRGERIRAPRRTPEELQTGQVAISRVLARETFPSRIVPRASFFRKI